MLAERKITRSRIFFGWWTVLFAGIFSGLGHGYYGYGVSVFFKSLAAELGLTRAVTSVATGIGRLEGGLESFLTGWLVDKFGPRWVVFTGIFIAAIGLALMNFINSVWQYLLVWGVIIGIGVNLALTVAVDKALTDWFIRKRGLAQGVKFALIGIAGVIVVPLVTWLVTAQGWRITCLIWAGLMLIGAPLALVFMKQKRPEFYGLLPDGARLTSASEVGVSDVIDKGVEYASSFEETEFTLRQAVKTPGYWLLSIVFAVQVTIMGGFNIHCIPFLTDMGIDPIVAGNMMGMMVFFTVPSRFLGGLIADRIGKSRLKFLLAGAFILQAIGIGVFLLNQNLTTIYILLILYGLGSGAGTPLFVITLGRYFGRKAFGSILGSTMVLRAPLSLAAPVYTGWIYDTTGSYATAFGVFAVLALFSTLLSCLIPVPTPSTTATDIQKFM